MCCGEDKEQRGSSFLQADPAGDHRYNQKEKHQSPLTKGSHGYLHLLYWHGEECCRALGVHRISECMSEARSAGEVSRRRDGIKLATLHLPRASTGLLGVQARPGWTGGTSRLKTEPTGCFLPKNVAYFGAIRYDCRCFAAQSASPDRPKSDAHSYTPHTTRCLAYRRAPHTHTVL